MTSNLPATFAPIRQGTRSRLTRALSVYWHAGNQPVGYLSSGAIAVLGKPERIEVGIDQARGEIAIAAAQPESENAITLLRHGGGAKFSLGAIAQVLTPEPGTTERYELFEREPGVLVATKGTTDQSASNTSRSGESRGNSTR